MGNRLILDQMLRALTNNVYYQPPTGTMMKYPAIKYSRSTIDIRHADDGSYSQDTNYEIIVIDRNPDSPIVDAVSKFSGIRHSRHYTADGLNHDVFNIYI